MFAWQATVQDDRGNAVVQPSITVYNSDGTTIADIYDETGAPKLNPFLGDNDGFAQFWAERGDYKISGASGTDATEVWDVSLGDWSQPFASHAAFMAANIPASVSRVSIIVGLIPSDNTRTLSFVRKSGVSLAGVKPGWVPDGVPCLDHFGDNVNPGTTDMAAAWAAMISAGAAMGGMCRLSPGSVYAASVFNIAQTVSIDGGGAELRKGTGFTSGALVRVGAPNVTIEDLFVDGLDMAPTGCISLVNSTSPGLTVRRVKCRRAQYGISANSNSNILIDECDIAETSNYSIRAHNLDDVAVLDNIVVKNCVLDRRSSDPVTTMNGCILIRGTDTKPTTNVIVSGNTMFHVSNPTSTAALCCEIRFANAPVFIGNTSTGGAMLVSIAGSKNASVTGNTSLGANAFAIEIANHFGTPCDNATVTGNSIDGQGILNYAIGFQGYDVGKGATISGNSCQGFYKYGFFANDMWSEMSITGNRFDFSVENTNQYGIYCLGPNTGLAISGNIINGNGFGEKAIYLWDANFATISGNTCRGFTQNDVFLHSTEGVNNITISGNTLGSGRAAGTVSRAGDGDFGSNIRIIGNVGFRPTNTVSANALDWIGGIIEAVVSLNPEGAVTASPGSTARRTNGGAGTAFYVKESGTGNTGWVSK